MAWFVSCPDAARRTGAWAVHRDDVQDADRRRLHGPGRGGEPAGVSMPAVAERAGVSVRTLYRYFPSKDDLQRYAAGWLDRRVLRRRWRTAPSTSPRCASTCGCCGWSSPTRCWPCACSTPPRRAGSCAAARLGAGPGAGRRRPPADDHRRAACRGRRPDRRHLLVVDVPRARRPHGPRPDRGGRPRRRPGRADRRTRSGPGDRPNGGSTMTTTTTPLTFDAAGPGHVGARPVALPAVGDAVYRRVASTTMTEAYRGIFAEWGAPLDTMEVRFVHGKMYRRLVPLVGADRTGPPPPRPVLWLATRLHPAFRRRERLARQTLAERPYLDVIDGMARRRAARRGSTATSPCRPSTPPGSTTPRSPTTSLRSTTTSSRAGSGTTSCTAATSARSATCSPTARGGGSTRSPCSASSTARRPRRARDAAMGGASSTRCARPGIDPATVTSLDEVRGDPDASDGARRLPRAVRLARHDVLRPRRADDRRAAERHVRADPGLRHRRSADAVDAGSGRAARATCRPPSERGSTSCSPTPAAPTACATTTARSPPSGRSGCCAGRSSRPAGGSPPAAASTTRRTCSSWTRPRSPRRCSIEPAPSAADAAGRAAAAARTRRQAVAPERARPGDAAAGHVGVPAGHPPGDGHHRRRGVATSRPIPRGVRRPPRPRHRLDRPPRRRPGGDRPGCACSTRCSRATSSSPRGPRRPTTPCWRSPAGSSCRRAGCSATPR